MTGHHMSGKTDYIKLSLEYEARAGRQYSKSLPCPGDRSPFQQPKNLPTASVLLVNVCVYVGCRREPGKTSWVPDQKMGDFVILYRVEVKRIRKKFN